MTPRENLIRAIRFESPERIPVNMHISAACWHHYDQEVLKDLHESHPLLFPEYRRPKGKVVPNCPPFARAGEPFTDAWGCTWETFEDGITGSVKGHPLKTWDDFDNYKAPDPNVTDGRMPVDWHAREERAGLIRQQGGLVSINLPHGHTYLRLLDIRGYENLTFDMADEEPCLEQLIEMISDFNYEFVTKSLALKPDIFGYPEDLGMQVGPMISPTHFRKYIKPVYQRIMRPALEQGCIVRMHSDGDIRDLADDLVDAGVEVLNLQDLVNGIDWIAEKYAGKICVDLDVDRQAVTRFGSPADIDALVREEVEKLGSRQGGLILTHGVYPGVPLENIRAVMDAFEKYALFYS